VAQQYRMICDLLVGLFATGRHGKDERGYGLLVELFATGRRGEDGREDRREEEKPEEQKG
jgi:hypothetical protein